MSGDTIAEYDVVLSISQDAINKQLQMLYDHKLENTFVPIQSEVEGGTPAAVPKYAINHEWMIQVETYVDRKTKKVKLDLATGIVAHIGAPRISLNDNGEATVEIVFQRDDSFEKNYTTDGDDVLDDMDVDISTLTNPDSILYQRGGGGQDPYLVAVKLNGWKIRWKASIRQAKIHDFMNQMVARHKDPNDPTYLPPGVENYLSSNVDPQHFTVSSIFCLFESTKFVNSFEVLTQNNTKPEDSTINDLMDHIVKYLSALGAKSKPEIPTPDNFVLGYGITQETQKLSDVKRDATWRDTPAYFMPATYDLSTTKASKEGNNSLNFCMVTHRSKGPNNDWRHVNINENKNAGNLVKSFSDRTNKFNDDAIMAWSREIFWKKWVLEEIWPTMYRDSALLLDDFVRRRGLKDYNPNWSDSDAVIRPNFWERNLTWKTDYIYEGRQGGLYWKYLWMDGNNNFKLEVSSDLQRNGNLPEDARRRVYVTANSEVRLRGNFETSPQIQGSGKNRAYEGAVTVRYKIVICIEAGPAGTWIVRAHEDTQPRRIADLLNRPSFNVKEDFLEFTDIGDSNPPGGYGAWIESRNHNNAHFFTDSGVQGQLKDAAKGVVNESVNGLMGRLDKMLNGMETMVMMPGGEVMTFNGMDADNDGQLYAHIRYALGAEGVKPV